MALYDLLDLQQRIHRKAELDSDYPTAGETDYTVRTGLINDWIHNWEDEEGVLWNELFTEGSITSTGATSYVLSSSAITNVKYPLGGFIRIVDSNSNTVLIYKIKKPHEVQLSVNSTEQYAYFLGDPQNGYTLYFNPSIPPTSGTTIKFAYYKKATELSSSTDKPEMVNPLYIVHGVVSDIYSTEDPSESDKNFQIAQAKLKAMKIRNMQPAWYQENYIKDRMTSFSFGGFGRGR